MARKPTEAQWSVLHMLAQGPRIWFSLRVAEGTYGALIRRGWIVETRVDGLAGVAITDAGREVHASRFVSVLYDDHEQPYRVLAGCPECPPNVTLAPSGTTR